MFKSQALRDSSLVTLLTKQDGEFPVLVVEPLVFRDSGCVKLLGFRL